MARQHVSLRLDKALLDRAQELTPDLDAMVEHLLSEFVALEDLRRSSTREGSALVHELNRLRLEHGSLADDFSPL